MKRVVWDKPVLKGPRIQFLSNKTSNLVTFSDANFFPTFFNQAPPAACKKRVCVITGQVWRPLFSFCVVLPLGKLSFVLDSCSLLSTLRLCWIVSCFCLPSFVSSASPQLDYCHHLQAPRLDSYSVHPKIWTPPPPLVCAYERLIRPKSPWHAQPAKYLDPVTGHPYANLAAFKKLREQAGAAQ